MARGGTSTNGRSCISSDSIRTMAGCCYHFKTILLLLAAYCPFHLFHHSFFHPIPINLQVRKIFTNDPTQLTIQVTHSSLACVCVSSWISAWSCSTSWRWDSSTVVIWSANARSFRSHSSTRPPWGIRINGALPARCPCIFYGLQKKENGGRFFIKEMVETS